jgi:DNA polymerase-3 subunit alpha
VFNKRTVESLIKAGAFDTLNHPRRALMEVYESAIDHVLDLKRNQAFGQDDLFGDGGGTEETAAPSSAAVPDMPDWDKRTKLAFEREMLGLYVSDHPLNGLDHVIASKRDVSISALHDEPREGMVTIAGMITQVQRKQNRQGETWAIITVEDLDASIDIMLFPKAYQSVAMALATDTVVSVTGRVRAREDGVEIAGSAVTVINVSASNAEPLTISVPVVRVTPELVSRLKGVLHNHPGSQEVRLRLLNGEAPKTLRLGADLRVATSGALMADLKALLGPACVA